MTLIKNKKDIKSMRESGRRLARVLDEVASHIAPGATPRELDAIAERLIREGGDIPAFLDYRPDGAAIPYPATLCVSVNSQVVHGIPGNTPLSEGDIVAVDIGLVHEGFVSDMARTFAVGGVDDTAQKLINITRAALAAGIKAACPGGHTGDIGEAIEGVVKSTGFSVVRELGGHGIGRRVHEDPFIANFGEAGTGVELQSGMALALEPIINEGSPDVALAPDGYTFETRDGKRSAHFEDTILITDKGAEVLTK